MGRKRHAANRRKPTRGQRRPSLTGTVRLTEAGGAIETAEGTFRLAGRSLREVMAGDTVAISTHRGNRGERRAVVEGVIERAATTVAGHLRAGGPLGLRAPPRHAPQGRFLRPSARPLRAGARRARGRRGERAHRELPFALRVGRGDHRAAAGRRRCARSGHPLHHGSLRPGGRLPRAGAPCGGGSSARYRGRPRGPAPPRRPRRVRPDHRPRRRARLR